MQIHIDPHSVAEKLVCYLPPELRSYTLNRWAYAESEYLRMVDCSKHHNGIYDGSYHASPIKTFKDKEIEIESNCVSGCLWYSKEVDAGSALSSLIQEMPHFGRERSSYLSQIGAADWAALVSSAKNNPKRLLSITSANSRQHKWAQGIYDVEAYRMLFDKKSSNEFHEWVKTWAPDREIRIIDWWLQI